MVSKSSDHMQRVSMVVNSGMIAAIRQTFAFKTANQTDEQIASGVVVSYIERYYANPHLSICCWAYATSVNIDEGDVRLTLEMAERHWRRIDEIVEEKRMGRSLNRDILIRWIIADTAEQLGYPR